MKRMLIDATLIINLKDVPVKVPEGVAGKEDYEEILCDLVMQHAEKKLVLLDRRGGVSGADGFIEHMQCEGIENWRTGEAD